MYGCMASHIGHVFKFLLSSAINNMEILVSQSCSLRIHLISCAFAKSELTLWDWFGGNSLMGTCSSSILTSHAMRRLPFSCSSHNRTDWNANRPRHRSSKAVGCRRRPGARGQGAITHATTALMSRDASSTIPAVACEDGPTKSSLHYEVGKTLTLSVNQGLPEDESTIESKLYALSNRPPCLVSWSTQSIWFWSSAIGVTQRNCVKTIRSIHDSIAWGCPSRFVENGDAAKSIAALDAETDDWSTPMRVKSPWLSEGLLTKECFSILCKCSRKRFFYEKFPLPSPRHNDWVHQGI